MMSPTRVTRVLRRTRSIHRSTSSIYKGADCFVSTPQRPEVACLFLVRLFPYIGGLAWVLIINALLLGVYIRPLILGS